MKPRLVHEEDRGAGGAGEAVAVPYESLEATQALAIETAHKNIARFHQMEFLHADEVKSLAELSRVIEAAKRMKMEHLVLRKKLGLPVKE